MDTEQRRVLPRTGYPRRRAVTACSTCRERKKKCDNLRPACTFCLQIGARCDYGARDSSSFDPASLTILDRLSVIESLVRDIQVSPPTDNRPPVQEHRRPTASPFPLSPDYTPGNRAVWSIDLDANYKVGTNKVLEWPVFERALTSLRRLPFLDFHGVESYTYLDDIYRKSQSRLAHLTEIRNRECIISINISAERSEIDTLVDKYFRRVYIKNPILDRHVVRRYCELYYENGPLFNLETCLVLIICALGAISDEFGPCKLSDNNCDSSYDQSARIETSRLANCYFAAAEKRLGAAMTVSSTIAIQCLCLAGIYHMYRLEPMAALRMFHAAGSSLQLLISTGADCLEGTSQQNSSLFWTCFKSEREILAEMPIGVPALSALGSSERYPPPPPGGHMSPGEDEWAQSEQDSWYFFLSEIALRRITNKVSEVVYNYIDAVLGSAPQTTSEDLIPIVEEFERQAESWREHLPQQIKFPDVPTPTDTEWQQYSRGRYYCVLELMHRPFVFAAIHVPDCSPVVHVLANKGLTNAFKYLQHCHLSHRHHGKWLQFRNALKQASLLLAASGSGLEMPLGWYGGVERTTRCFEYWGWESPSCESYGNVLVTLENHFRSYSVTESTPGNNTQ